MNLPTQLTIARALLTVVIIALLLLPGWLGPLLGILVFVIAGFTDWLDGYLARRWKQTSPLGALLDPLADKVLVLGVLSVFAHRLLIPWWVVAVVLVRELLVTTARAWAANRGVVLGAAKEGKHKMVWQLITLGCFMLVMLMSALARSVPELDVARVWIERAGLIALAIMVLLTVASGISFFWRNWRVWAA